MLLSAGSQGWKEALCVSYIIKLIEPFHFWNLLSRCNYQKKKPLSTQRKIPQRLGLKIAIAVNRHIVLKVVTFLCSVGFLNNLFTPFFLAEAEMHP